MVSLGQQTRQLVETLEKVEARLFTVDDLSLFFLRLRERNHGDSVFRELADFVAHPQRDRGITTDSLREMHLSMRWLEEYTIPNRALDLEKPFPSWIRELVMLRLIARGTHVHEVFGLSTDEFRKLDRANYRKVDNANGAYAPQHKGSRLTQVIADLLSAIHVRPAYTQSTVLSAIINVASLNALAARDRIEAIFEGRGSEVTAAVLCLLHGSKISLDGAEGSCRIGVPPQSNLIELMGHVPHPSGVHSAFGVMQTELDSSYVLGACDAGSDVHLTENYEIAFVPQGAGRRQ